MFKLLFALSYKHRGELGSESISAQKVFFESGDAMADFRYVELVS